MRTVPCPSCGAPLPAGNPGVVTAVCRHCGTAAYWDGEALLDTGWKSRLSEGFTRLYTGAGGSLRGRRLTVLGRVRYAFPQGFWDEWFVALEDGAQVWVSEDDHELALEGPGKIGPVPPFRSLVPGKTVEVAGEVWAVEELGRARCVGVEGQLPERYEIGEEYNYIDASTPDGKKCLGLEYDQDDPGQATIFQGVWLGAGDLSLDDEGADW